MMRRSIIIEGVVENRGEDLIDFVVDMADTLNITFYSGEISQIRRIGQYTRNSLQPRPIKVTFTGERKRDRFLQCKRHLFDTRIYHNVVIYPDDKPEVRTFKAHLRMAATTARSRGDQVWQRYNAIIVNGKKYEYANYTQLAKDFPYPGHVSSKPPKIYSPDSTEAPKTLEMLREEKKRTQSEIQVDMDVQTDTSNGSQSTQPTLNKIRSLTKEESDEIIESLGSHRCVQITPFGIGFYTGECLLSNHYKVKFAPSTFSLRDERWNNYGLVTPWSVLFIYSPKD